MLKTRDESLKNKICLVSGSGNVAQYTTEKILEMGGKVVTLSDSGGYIYDETGIDNDKLDFVKTIKNIKRGRISQYLVKHPHAVYCPVDSGIEHNPLWNHPADCAFPNATENEINGNDAQNLINNNVYLVNEGANMPTTQDGVDKFLKNNTLYGPSKAANACGVAVSGLEMAQKRGG